MPPKQKAVKTTTKRKASSVKKSTVTVPGQTTKEAKSTTPRFQHSTTPRWPDIFKSAAKNDTAAVKYFIEQNNCDARLTNAEEKSVMLIAAENNNLPMLQWILEKDAALLKLPDVFGNTVMDRAIENGAIDMVKLLVEEHEWDVSRQNKHSFGNTPIHVAAEEGQLEILKYFIEEKKGDPNIRNDAGDPPAFLAADKPHEHIVKYLLEVEVKVEDAGGGSKGGRCFQYLSYKTQRGQSSTKHQKAPFKREQQLQTKMKEG
jgi:hypothetical protein